MATPRLNFSIAQGGLQRNPETRDGVTLMVVTAKNGYSFTGGLVKSVSEAESNGITVDNDSTYDNLVWEHIKDFYALAGEGTELHILKLGDGVTLTNMFTVGNAAYTAIFNYLNAQNGDIKNLFVALNPSSTESIGTDGISADLKSAIPLAQVFASRMLTEQYAPIDIFLEGRMVNLSSWNSLINLRSLSTECPNISVMIGRDYERANSQPLIDNAMASNYAAIGLLAGRNAKINVNVSHGRVKDGAVILDSKRPQLSGGKEVSQLSKTEIDTIYDRGFTFLRIHPGRNGLYFVECPTAAKITNDLAFRNNSRVINKAVRIAADVYLDALNDTLLFDANTGKLSIEAIKSLEADIETRINDEMGKRGEISGVNAYINPDDDVISNDSTSITLNVVPTGTNRTINIKVGFTKTV
jgi:hypothetical protein